MKITLNDWSGTLTFAVASLWSSSLSWMRTGTSLGSGGSSESCSTQTHTLSESTDKQINNFTQQISVCRMKCANVMDICRYCL